MSTSNVKLELKDFCKPFIITVGSGEKKKKFAACSGLLSPQSFYFERACSEAWSETDKTLNFPDERPETFEVFMAWLNTGNINHASSLQVSKETNAETQKKNLSQRWLQLLHCYLMADYIQAPIYANIIMDALIEALKNWEDQPGDELTPLCDNMIESINLVRDGTLPKSPLRRLCIDSIITTTHVSSEMVQKHFSDSVAPPDGPNLMVPHTFLLEILEEKFGIFNKETPISIPWAMDTSRYHVIQNLPRSQSNA